MEQSQLYENRFSLGQTVYYPEAEVVSGENCNICNGKLKITKKFLDANISIPCLCCLNNNNYIYNPVEDVVLKILNTSIFKGEKTISFHGCLKYSRQLFANLEDCQQRCDELNTQTDDYHKELIDELIFEQYLRERDIETIQVTNMDIIYKLILLSNNKLKKYVNKRMKTYDQ